MSAGIKANNDGSAAIQVGGTDYIQISSTGNVTIPQSQTISGNLTVTGTVTAGSGDVYLLYQYTTPGNYAKPAGLRQVKVTVIGGGGAGTPSSGSGGSSGGAAIRVYPGPSLPASPIPYSIGLGAPGSPGTGGTTSFGVAPMTVISATGGGPGATQGSSSNGGFGANGNINMGGFAGNAAQTNTGGPGGGPGGGSGPTGGGNASGNLGGGGQGGASPTFPPAQIAGDGAPGCVIIEEFY